MTIMDAFILGREKNMARVYEDDDMIRFLQQKIQYYGLREFCRIHGLDEEPEILTPYEARKRLV